MTPLSDLRKHAGLPFIIGNPATMTINRSIQPVMTTATSAATSPKMDGPHRPILHLTPGAEASLGASQEYQRAKRNWTHPGKIIAGTSLLSHAIIPA
jgi:hypothetical protein